MKYLAHFEDILQLLWTSQTCGGWNLCTHNVNGSDPFLNMVVQAVLAVNQSFPSLLIQSVQFNMVDEHEGEFPYWEPTLGDLETWISSCSLQAQSIEMVVATYSFRISLEDVSGNPIEEYFFDDLAVLYLPNEGEERMNAELSITPDIFSDWLTEKNCKEHSRGTPEDWARLGLLLKSNRQELSKGLMAWEQAMSAKITGFTSQTNALQVYEFGFREA